jgi:hypothetical protein
VAEEVEVARTAAVAVLVLVEEDAWFLKMEVLNLVVAEEVGEAPYFHAPVVVVGREAY